MTTEALARTFAASIGNTSIGGAWARRDRRRGGVGAGPAVREPSPSRGVSRDGADASVDHDLSRFPFLVPPIAPPGRGDPASPRGADVAPPLAAALAPALVRARRRANLLSFLAVLLVHVLGLAATVWIPAEEHEGGGEALVLAVEFVAPDATDTIDAAAGAPQAPQPIDVTADLAATTADPVPPPPPDVADDVATFPPLLATRAAREDFVEPPPEVREASAPPSISPPKTSREAARPRAETKPVKASSKTRSARRTPSPARDRPTTATAATGSGGAAADRRAGGGLSRGAAAADQGDLRSWRSAVLAALARAKVYPEEARSAGRSGRVVVRFTIRPDGSVVGLALASASGVGSLDAATLAMPRRAHFPPMPAGAGVSQSFTAGVRYDLR